MTKPKTSTLFRVDRTSCDPSKWTIGEWARFAEFVRSGDVELAQLSDMGITVVEDDRLMPQLPGPIERAGFSPDTALCDIYENLDEMVEAIDFDVGHVIEVVPVYRGVTVYAVPYTVGDVDEGTHVEVDVFVDLPRAQAFAKAMTEEQPADAPVS